MGLLSTKLPWELAQTKWPATLNPIIALPILQGNQIDDIILKANVAQAINHLLQQTPQGWLIVDNIADAVIWRPANWNKNTITLESSADTTISIWVY